MDGRCFQCDEHILTLPQHQQTWCTKTQMDQLPIRCLNHGHGNHKHTGPQNFHETRTVQSQLVSRHSFGEHIPQLMYNTQDEYFDLQFALEHKSDAREYA